MGFEAFQCFEAHNFWHWPVAWRLLAGSLSASRTATSWLPEESQVESCEHQDNADIHDQPLPEAISEEHEIHADDDGYHRHHVKHDGYLSAHFRWCPNLKFRDDVAG
jgi:hypothetical protein